jgi:hypothetical protein
MDSGVLLETKTLVELVCHYIRVFSVRKIPAIFIVVVFENTSGLWFVYKTKLRRNFFYLLVYEFDLKKRRSVQVGKKI